MPRLLASRAWSVLALFAGITSIWAGDVSWLQLACAAGLVIGIAQQLVLLGLSIHTRTLETFRVRLSAATMLCAGVACWYLANSPRLAVPRRCRLAGSTCRPVVVLRRPQRR